jgi:hypothetical protein
MADAGDSPFVASGRKATFIGAALGGSAPYTFAWASPVGVLADGGTGATALLDTTGVAPGTYALTFTVRDAAGTTATDTVKVVVATAATQTLLDATKSDPVVANVGIGNPTLTSYLDFPFQVPAGLTSMTVTATWTNIANDYDLHVVDPSGVEAQGGYSGNGATNQTFQIEIAGAATPVAGTWTVRMERYLTVTDSVHVVVTGKVLSADPRPTVAAGGPYRFAIGAPRPSTARAGGTAPLPLPGTSATTASSRRPASTSASLRRAMAGDPQVTDARGPSGARRVRVVADPARLPSTRPRSRSSAWPTPA